MPPRKVAVTAGEFQELAVEILGDLAMVPAKLPKSWFPQIGAGINRANFSAPLEAVEFLNHLKTWMTIPMYVSGIASKSAEWKQRWEVQRKTYSAHAGQVTRPKPTWQPHYAGAPVEREIPTE